MTEQLNKALDHLIILHKIEEKKFPSLKVGRALGLGIFLLGIGLFVGGALYYLPKATQTGSIVNKAEPEPQMVILENGSIIFIHKGDEFTTDTLKELIAALKEKGYFLVPAPE